MAVTIMQPESVVTFNSTEACAIGELNQADEVEVLDFLAARPIHTVFMASSVRDNGLLSPHNRGSFYACRDRQGRLEGVALIGQATFFEARTEASLSAFAWLARNCLNANLIRGEVEAMDRFWKYYATNGQEPRLISRELLFTQYEALPLQDQVEGLRPATADDLEAVMKINAAMAFQEGGVSPLHCDPSGFRQRTARRIQQDRVWVWVEDGRLIFKADVIGETPEAAYLEGVYVNPEERLKGYGRRCLTQLAQTLLTRSQAICLAVNQQNKKAPAFYERTGYKFHSDYETIYLR